MCVHSIPSRTYLRAEAPHKQPSYGGDYFHHQHRVFAKNAQEHARKQHRALDLHSTWPSNGKETKHLLVLLLLQRQFNKYLLQLLVAVVDDKLLEAVLLRWVNTAQPPKDPSNSGTP